MTDSLRPRDHIRDAITKGDPRDGLLSLVALLTGDDDLSVDDVRRIATATAVQVDKLRLERDARKLAHVHDFPHLPVKSLVPLTVSGNEGEAFRNAPDVPPEANWLEYVDSTAMHCCDCRRELVADASEVRILVCSRLHPSSRDPGLRPPELVPTDPDGAVECGRP